MTTKHEYCDYLDNQQQDAPDYDEQLLIVQEIEETREETLRRQGAKEALSELKMYLAFCGADNHHRNQAEGLLWSINAIDQRLATLTQINL